MADLSVNIGKLALSNPVMTAHSVTDLNSKTLWIWRKLEELS